MWSHRGPNNSTTWILGLWHFNFNSGIGAIGKTRVAPNTSKTGTAWWVASNQKSYIFRCTTQCKAGSGPKLASLGQPPVLKRSGLTWTQSIAQPGRTILDLAATTSEVASVQLAGLGWLPRQTQLWRRTWERGQSAWNVKSTTIRKPDYLFNSGLRVIGKTRVAPKTSKTSTAWWVASNQKSHIFRCTTQSWIACPKHAISVRPGAQ